MTGPSGTPPDPVPPGDLDGGAATPSAPVPRPAPVTAAAAVGFVVGFYALLNALVLLAAATVYALFAVFGVLYLGIAVMTVWGGVQALSGRGGTVLRIGGLVTAGLALLGAITSLTQGEFSAWSILLVAAGVGIFVLLNQPASQRYFAAR